MAAGLQGRGVLVMVSAALAVGALTGAMPAPAYTGPIWSPFPLPAAQSVPGGSIPPGAGAAARRAQAAPREPDAVPKARFRPGGTVWPAASSGTLVVSESVPVRRGRLSGWTSRMLPGWKLLRGGPVSVRGVPGGGDVGAVRVNVAAHAGAVRAGVPDGVVMSLAGGPGPVRVRVSYAGFGGMFGGAWAWRLRLVRLPACALTEPRRPACHRMTPVGSVNDAAGRYVEATVGIGGARTVMALMSAPAGPTGSFAATPLRPSGTWAVQQGSFNYSYPITVPPALAGQAADVTLSYNSQSIDSETSGSNTQGGMIGDGWDFTPGFIERSYESCQQDGISNSGDLCWGGQNATLSLGAHSSQLVEDSNGNWHPQGDDGTQVQLLTGAANGLWNGEYWLVTTTDGTQYYFGADHFPGGTNSDPSNQSAWGEPVFNPGTTDPCYKASAGQASECQMGWRWNLDFVVDPQQHLTQYVYTPETNYYNMGGGQGTGTLTQYDRGGYLKQLKYGFLLPDAIAGANPAVLVNFGYSERCLDTASVCDPNHDAAHWPDVPWDQSCGSTGSCTNVSPTFFSTERLTSITTKVREAATYTAVDAYALTQAFPSGAGSSPVMSLMSIARTGEDDGGGATGTLPVPKVLFTTTEFDNRVDGLTPAAPPVDRPRISSIATETGASIAVTYQPAGCSRVNNIMPAHDYSNTLPCFPVYWTPSTAQIKDWFLKYLISEVTESDQTGAGSPALEWRYSYLNGAAWHNDNNPLIPASNRTWDIYRGFQQIKTLTGAPGDPVGQEIQTYMQGMDGDNNGLGGTKSVTVPDSVGDNVTDSNWLAGQVLEDDTYTQSGGSVVKKIVNGPWSYNQTASQSEPGTLPDLTAHMLAASQTRTMQLFTGSAWDTRQVNTYFNGNAQVSAVDDDPEGSAETCTSTSYANPPAGNPNMEDYPDKVTVVTGPYSASSGSCPAASSGNIVSQSSTYYDASSPTLASLGTLGSLAYPGGLVTGTSKLVSWGSPEQAQTATTYDGLGRVAAVTTPTPAGASGGPVTTTTSYSPAYAKGQSTDLPTSVLVVNPLTWHTTTAFDEGREQPLTITDQNAEETTATYDPLGRLTAVTAPADQSAKAATEKFSYTITGTAPSAVTTQTLREDGSYNADVKIYDGMDQLRQEQATPADAAAGRVITDTFYNSDGWAVKTRNPYYDSATAPGTTMFEPSGGDGAIPGWTATSYDATGRVTASAFNSGNTRQWQTTTAYPGLNETDVTPPAGGTATSTFTNDLGQTTASWQYPNLSAPDGHPADADIASYAYTPAGQVHTVTDNAGNNWIYSYDLAGRKTAEADPGTTAAATWTYDGAGNIDTATNADGSEVSYSYDLIGRKTAEYSGTRTGGVQLDAWAYDTANLNGGPAKAVGQLASATSYDTYGGASGGPYTEQITGYNTAYEPTGTSTSVPASDLVPGAAGTDKFTTTSTYTPLTGLLSTVEYSADQGLPDETVNYSFNLEGELIATGGATAYLDQTIYDAFGRIQRTTYGLYGQQLVQTYAQDAGTGWLTASTTNLQTYPAAADSVSYAYNQAGDLTAASDIQNAGGTRTQCYAYNDQQELTAAWTDTKGITTAAAPSVSGIGGCTTTSPSATTIGGPAPYWQSYGYDPLGDRTTATFHDLSGNTAKDINQTLAYPGNGTAPASQPDAPATITTQYGTTGSKDTTTAAYDAAGNTTSQKVQTTGTSPPPAPPAESAITYNPAGQTATTATAAGTSGYTYDASGTLLLQTDPATSTTPASNTLYLDGGAEQITYTAPAGSTPADVKATRFYAGPDGTVVTRTYDGDAKTTTLTEQPGTPQGTATDSVTDDTSQQLTRRYFDPYGNPAGTAQPWPDNLAFTGKPADPATGLGLLGARQYDPATGRFLSLDPIFQPGNPESMGGYAYAADNPATHADPTGQCPCFTDGSTERKNPNTGTYSGGGGGETNPYPGTGGEASTGTGGQAPGTDILPPAVRAAYQNFFSDYAHLSEATGAQLELDALDGFCGQSVGGKLCGASLTYSIWSDYETSKAPMGIFMDPGLSDGGDFGVIHEAATQETDQLFIAELTGDQGAGASTDFHLSATCGGESFTAGTKVLLASGRAVPIASLKPGDKVLATDTRTGKTSAETVRAVMVHHDTNRYDLTVRTAHASAVIQTTSNHLFWDPTVRHWVQAVTLGQGTSLRTAEGGTVTVRGGYAPANHAGWMWDLTIAADHDFYVEAASVAILVHNSGCAPLRVIGHDPDYWTLGNRIGAKYFSVPDDAWNSMSPKEQWEANQRFLDRGIAEGATFRLATPIDDIDFSRPWYPQEVNYLLDHGYTFNDSGIAMIPEP